MKLKKEGNGYHKDADSSTKNHIYKYPQLIIFYPSSLCRENLTYIYENNFPHLSKEHHDSIILLSPHAASSVPIAFIQAFIRARKITKTFHIYNQHPDCREWTDRDQADVCIMVLLRKADRSNRGRLHDYSKEQKCHTVLPLSVTSSRFVKRELAQFFGK